MCTLRRLGALLMLCFLLVGCDVIWSGLPADNSVLDGPIQGLTQAQLRAFLAGDEEFSQRFVPATGLGPVFVHNSCEGCHTADGKGHPSTNLIRFGVGDPKDAARFDYLLGQGGPQLQQRAIPGYQGETLPEVKGLATSVRSAPIVSGLGLIEFIPEATILAHADPDDKDKDGISGRPNYVKPPSYHEPVIQNTPVDGLLLGRFGRKATAINLLHQTVSAYLNDMGITSDFSPVDLYNPRVGGPSGDGVADPEVSSATVRNVVFYLQTLKAPIRRNPTSPEVQQGEALFAKIGCAKCHVPQMKTGPSPIEALANKEVHLYSDLLLHDMGETLADGFPEGQATGREWRTTPLWGVGIVGDLLGGQGFYLHDGRAKTLDEAIRLHGGEAQTITDAYIALNEADKARLIAFLRSL